MPALAERFCIKNKLVTILAKKWARRQPLVFVCICIFFPLIYFYKSFIFLFTFGRDARVEVTGKVEIIDHCLMTWANNISWSFSWWKITKNYEDNYGYFLKIFLGQFLFFIFFIFIPSSLAAITGASTVKKISS